MAETVETDKGHNGGFPLIQQLMRLSRDRDLGPLAELRRGAGQWPDCGASVLRHVAPFFGSAEARGWTRDRENAMLLVATLFAHHPSDRDVDDDMGAVLRKVAAARGSDSSVERRFLALLGARGEAVATHLRHAVALACASGVPVGWNALLRDAERLISEDESRRQQVVLKWSRSFWSKADENDSTES